MFMLSCIGVTPIIVLFLIGLALLPWVRSNAEVRRNRSRVKA